ncbi:hypothetical protein GYMLUDRAFT_70662 [Collybiopsis luxurians FD-317 M1]|nr:hypothetical protein GYMLUDRAFT_70662 [Collybiopsis luxurians FD-317 M1]
MVSERHFWGVNRGFVWVATGIGLAMAYRKAQRSMKRERVRYEDRQTAGSKSHRR